MEWLIDIPIIIGIEAVVIWVSWKLANRVSKTQNL